MTSLDSDRDGKALSEMMVRLVGLVAILGVGACGGKDAPDSSGGSGGSSAAKPEPPKVTCADLPGAPRTNLQLSKDKKTLYYVEQATKKIGDERVVSNNLHSLDIATRTSKLVVSDVSRDSVVAPDGTIVFRRPVAKLDFMGKRKYALMIKPPGKEPIAVTDEKSDVGEFVVDPESAMVAFIMGDYFPDEGWKVPLAGGKPESLGKTFRLYGVADKSVIMSGMRKLVKQPLAGGAPSDLTLPDSFLVGFYGGRIVMQNKATKALVSAPVSALDKKVDLKLTYEDVTLQSSPGGAVLIADKDNTQLLHAIDETGSKPLLVTRKGRPSHVVQVNDQVAMLVISDTNADGDQLPDDEADVCFASIGGEVELPNRLLPKRFADVATRLGPITKEGDLAGAKLRFTTDGATEYVEFAATKGPTDLDKLRALAKSTQDQVTKLSGLAQLSVAIEVADTGRRALSRWDGHANAFLTSAGMGTAQVVDRTQYLLEVDPKVSLAMSANRYNRESEIGDATCSGTIKNISDHELANLEAECSNQTFGEERQEKAKVSPAKLAPNATGTYKIKLGVVDGSKAIPLTIYSGGNRLTFLNAFATKRADAILATATKVQEATKLSFYSLTSVTTGPSYARKKVVKVFLHVDKALDGGTNAARTAAASAALPLLDEYIKTDKNLEGTAVLYLLRHDSFKTGWTYEDGRLVDGEPKEN